VRVMAIAAHPDDETLGCGGTLLKHRASGEELHWLIATSRSTPRWSTEAVKTQDAQVEAVARAYSVERVHRLGFPDAGLDTVPISSLIESIDVAVSGVRPALVYVVHGGDVHTDHSLVYSAVMSALKSFRMSALGIRRVMSFETLSSTDAGPQNDSNAFRPNVYSDISPYLEEKCRILSLYETEVQEGWLPRTQSAVAALARTRGASVGVQHAEAFALLRELV
jgi:N-acetylglucosamine malate deacetylase 1